MCGLVGIVSTQAMSKVPVIHNMLKIQHHRGPDETGLYTNEHCLLGHNRLSIVDLSSGQQPMQSSDSRYTVVFNGEIYGYKKIKEQLHYNFKTESDTEVLLALYQIYGVDMLKHLPGMFSFAIWDDVKKELFFARDRIGEKPFYFARTTDGSFIFASEIKTIARSGQVNLEINMSSVAHYLNKAYVHPNHSIYNSIESLPAGHYGLYKDSEIQIQRYWSTHFEPLNISYLEAIEQLEFLFKQSIEEQLIADVPVSVFLSGGLDSSSVAAYAAKAHPSIEALTYRFDSTLDEGKYALDVAHMHAIKLSELWEDKSLDTVDLLQKMIDCYDEPFADSSAFPTMQICSLAAKKTKVVLSGDGADELFGGYVRRYRTSVQMEKMLGNSKLRLTAARFLFASLNRLHSNQKIFQKSWAAKQLLGGLSLVEGADEQNGIFKNSELASIGLTRQNSIFPCRVNTTNSVMELDVLNYLPGNILVKTDRASMAAGLEVRTPFLSKNIVEFALSLPSNFKIDAKNDKIIMRDTFGATWPNSIKNRSKQGFGFPPSTWLQQKNMRDFQRSTFNANSKIYSLINNDFINKYKSDMGMNGWMLLVLASWMNKN
jgi:asparagine synthase (glutamine-hydrolysing)